MQLQNIYFAIGLPNNYFWSFWVGNACPKWRALFGVILFENQEIHHFLDNDTCNTLYVSMDLSQLFDMFLSPPFLPPVCLQHIYWCRCMTPYYYTQHINMFWFQPERVLGDEYGIPSEVWSLGLFLLEVKYYIGGVNVILITKMFYTCIETIHYTCLYFQLTWICIVDGSSLMNLMVNIKSRNSVSLWLYYIMLIGFIINKLKHLRDNDYRVHLKYLVYILSYPTTAYFQWELLKNDPYTYTQ